MKLDDTPGTEMTVDASDIRDLEQMLNDGEGDADLSRRAIEIIERLNREHREARYKIDNRLRARLAHEDTDFKRIISEILRRRHDHVLDRFFEHIERNQYDWNGPHPPWKLSTHTSRPAPSHPLLNDGEYEKDEWDHWRPSKEFYSLKREGDATTHFLTL